MADEALPAPTTMVRPAGAGGKFGGTQRAGSAAATAASNIRRSRAHSSTGRVREQDRIVPRW